MDKHKPYTLIEMFELLEKGGDWRKKLDQQRLFANGALADGSEYRQLRAEIERLGAELAIARTALNKIVDSGKSTACPNGHVYDDCDCRGSYALGTAREALRKIRPDQCKVCGK